MPIDASIYQNIKPIPVNLPDPNQAVEGALKMRDLGIQMQTQQAVRQAYASNVDPQTGQINQQGFLSHLGKMAPQAVMQYQQHFAQMNKQQAEAQAAQVDAAEKMTGITGPKFDLIAGTPEDQRPAVYRSAMKAIADQGVDTSHMPADYDPGLFKQSYDLWQKSKPHAELFLKQAEAKKAMAEADPQIIWAKLQNDKYGSRSPNAELTSQYGKDVGPIRSSQVNMEQMLDSYNNKTPQGDASLVLQNFKIRNPSVPDVNSIEEMKASQAVSDVWKNRMTHALAGGFDDATRDNLIRDGISAFRANVTSYRGIQKRYQDRQKFQGVEDPTLTAEPAIEETYKNAIALQDKLGPYKPPAERGGVGGVLTKAASKIMGAGGGKDANASTQKFRAAGSKVSSDEVAQYATEHGMKLIDAQNHLTNHGYVINR